MSLQPYNTGTIDLLPYPEHRELVVADLKKEGVKIIEHHQLDQLREYAEVDSTEDTALFSI